MVVKFEKATFTVIESVVDQTLFQRSIMVVPIL